MVTHPSTNRAQRRVTSFMRRTTLLLRQTAKSFCSTCPYHHNLFCSSTEIMSSNSSLSLNSLLGTVSCSFMPHIILPFSSLPSEVPSHFPFLQATNRRTIIFKCNNNYTKIQKLFNTKSSVIHRATYKWLNVKTNYNNRQTIKTKHRSSRVKFNVPSKGKYVTSVFTVNLLTATSSTTIWSQPTNNVKALKEARWSSRSSINSTMFH